MNILSKLKVPVIGKIRDPEARAREAEFKQAVRELKRLSDRELWDIGVSRDDIERAVRFGVPANDPDFNQRAS